MTAESDTPREMSFEAALAALEAIVHELEEGKIGLAESLARYEQGVGLLKQCQALLERVERRIELLSGADSSGTAVTEKFDDRVLSLEEKAQTRGRRRSNRQRPESLPNEAPPMRSGEVDEPGTLF